MGEADKAITLLEEALRIYPVDGRFRMLLTSWLAEQQRFSEAMRLILPMKRLNPYNEQVWHLYEQVINGLEAQLGYPLPRISSVILEINRHVLQQNPSQVKSQCSLLNHLEINQLHFQPYLE
jgi:hypothetical protein